MLSSLNKDIIIIIIIITFFQDDSIFGTNANLTYGPQIQRHAFDNYNNMNIIYSTYRAGEVSVHRACCELATQPYLLIGGGTITRQYPHYNIHPSNSLHNNYYAL